MKHSILLTAVLSISMVGAASAQAMDQPATTTTTTTTYVDSACGTWQDDTWVSNGTCASSTTTTYRHERVAGTITSVQGHLVTVQQADKTVVINDQPALNRQLSGKVAVGRNIVAHGYWDGGTFYATLVATSDVPAAAP